MSKKEWLKLAEVCMKNRFGISTKKAGTTPEELYESHGWESDRITQRSPHAAVVAYGMKHDLIDWSVLK